MTAIKKKPSVLALAAVIALALVFGSLGLTGLDATAAFADEEGGNATAPKAKTVAIKYKGVRGAKNPNPSKVKKGATLKLKSPSKTGYKFKGWYQGKKKVTKLAKVKKAVALKAKWKAKSYKIAYKNVKGTNKNAKTFKYGKKVKLKALKKDGYEFKGWYADKELTKKVKKVGGKTTKAVTVYARWLKEPTTVEEAIGLEAAAQVVKEINDGGALEYSESVYDDYGVWIDPTGKKFGCSKALLVQGMKESGEFSAKTIKFVAANVDVNWYLQALMTADYLTNLSPENLGDGLTLQEYTRWVLEAHLFTESEIEYALEHTKY